MLIHNRFRFRSTLFGSIEALVINNVHNCIQNPALCPGSCLERAGTGESQVVSGTGHFLAIPVSGGAGNRPPADAAQQWLQGEMGRFFYMGNNDLQ
jgi:hypothetical protein